MNWKQLMTGIVLFFLISCHKKTETAVADCSDGFIEYYGSPAADGLSWVYVSNGQTYIPENLPESFKTTHLQVHACLTKTENRVSCFCAGPVYYYHIVSIR